MLWHSRGHGRDCGCCCGCGRGRGRDMDRRHYHKSIDVVVVVVVDKVVIMHAPALVREGEQHTLAYTQPQDIETNTAHAQTHTLSCV